MSTGAPTTHQKRIGRNLRAAFWGLLVLGVLLFAYARWVEPYWIQVTYHRVEAPVSPPIKIAHVSDLHLREIGRRERTVLQVLAREKPDVILITGDNIVDDADFGRVRAFLSQLHAPLGVWFVRGNWENYRTVANEHAFYAGAGVRFLLNESRELRPGVWVAGLDEVAWGHPDVDAAFAGIPRDAYVIAMFHTPALFDRVAGRCQFALAGHSHGGQIVVPLYGPLWLPAGVNEYLKGWYEKNGSKMYVSRGIGTTILHFRFFCRPEIAFLSVGR